MTQQEITLLNLGNSLDDLANLDPRGYGVCKLLYKKSREYTGKPLCVNGAQKLADALKDGGLVYIMSGFVLMPYNKAETDGVISSVLLARALIKAFNAKPVIICPEDAKPAVEALSAFLTDSAVKARVFIKDASNAEECADKIIAEGLPNAVISIECSGANADSVYHNARGLDVTAVQAKQDILFQKFFDAGVLNIAVGDLGNEIGMGAMGEYIKENIPVSCECGCENGIIAKTAADNIITATVSDWGCYSLIAMLAYILENPDIMHTAEIQEKAMKIGVENGLIDMYGEHIPAIDGFGLEINRSIVMLMGELVKSALNLKEKCKPWFDDIIKIDSFNR